MSRDIVQKCTGCSIPRCNVKMHWLIHTKRYNVKMHWLIHTKRHNVKMHWLIHTKRCNVKMHWLIHTKRCNVKIHWLIHTMEFTVKMHWLLHTARCNVKMHWSCHNKEIYCKNVRIHPYQVNVDDRELYCASHPDFQGAHVADGHLDESVELDDGVGHQLNLQRGVTSHRHHPELGCY